MMNQVRASRGWLGEGCVVINEGPDVYVMEDNRIRLEPGEALACVAVPEFWQGSARGGSFLYRMTREEAEAWAHDASLPPHRIGPAGQLEDSSRRLFHAYTEGTEYRASVRVEEGREGMEPLVTGHTNFIGHLQPK